MACTHAATPSRRSLSLADSDETEARPSGEGRGWDGLGCCTDGQLEMAAQQVAQQRSVSQAVTESQWAGPLRCAALRSVESFVHDPLFWCNTQHDGSNDDKANR